MYKIVICFLGALLLLSRVDGASCGCCPWERYYDYSYDDCLYYGYEDLYNPPYGYALPLNCYFNYCPCRCNPNIRIYYNNRTNETYVEQSYCEYCGQYH